MKQFFATILALLYLATSSVATVTLHYCMGEVVAKSEVKTAACGKCGMEQKSGCCEDKVKVVKTQDNHSFQPSDFTVTPFVAIVNADYLTTVPAPVITAATPAAQSNSPPGSPGISLCILHCVFRL